MELLLVTLMALAALTVAGLRLLLRLRRGCPSPALLPARVIPLPRARRAGWWLPSLVILAVGGLSLLAMLQILPLSEARAQGSGDLQVRKELSGGATTGTFQSGEEIVFTIAYRCAKVVGSCQAVTITDTFVSDLEFLGIDSLLPTASYGQNGQVVTVDLGDLPAGDTGIFQMRARFRLGTLPGTTVTNTVTMGSPNATPPTATSNQVTVTASGSFRMTVNKGVVNNAQTGVIGSQFQTTYQLNICNPNGGLGGVPLQNATITDTLPANAVPVLPVPNGGVYNAGPPRQVVWTGLTLPVTNGCYTLSLPVRFSGVTSGTLVNNRFQVSGKPADNPTTTTALGPTGHTLTLRDPYYAAALNKSAATASDHPDDPGLEELAGRPVTYTLTYNNIGTLPITNVVVTDDIPSEIVTITQVTINPVTPTQLVTLAYELNNSGIFTVYGAYAASTSVDLSGLSRITGLRWQLGQVPLDSGWSSDYTGISDSALNENDSFTNCATGVGFSDGSNRVTNACQTVEIISLRAIPRVEKRLNEPGQHLPEEVVSYTLRVYNDDVAHNNVLAPITLIDLLPEELEVVVFDSGAWRLATSTDSWYAYTGPAGAPSPVAVFTPTFTLDNETLLRWRWTAPYELPPGEELIVSFAVRIKRGTPPGNLDNVAIQLWDEPGTTNELYCVGGQVHTDTQDLDGDGNIAEQGCRSENEPTQVGVFLAMKSEKFVLGELDSGWNKDGWTVPGGNVDYRMVITNISNVTTTDIVVYDIFPFIGDTGVVDLSSRDSDWRPNLQQPISTPPGTPLTIQYSRSQNPCRPEVVPSGPPGCVDDWSTSPPADLTSVQAIRLEFCDAGGCLDLGPDPGDGSGGRLEFSWNMQAPNDAPADPARAWNSFGFTAAGGGLQLLPAEPNKVGIRVQRYVTDTVNLGNYVWLDVYGQQNDGIQQPEESGINGVRVELLDESGNPVDENGDGQNDYRITGDDQFGNPGYYLFVGLPANMTYTVRFYPPLTYTLGPELPVNYNTSTANQGGDDELDSDGIVTGTNPTGDYIDTNLITTTLALTTDLRWDQGLWLPTDYGDAPNSYKTSVAGLIANSENPALAARHVILPGIYMGSRVDAELDGPISTAFGDDTDVNPDDEDGVTFEVYTGTLQTPTAVMIIGDTADLTVTAAVPASYTGYLNAWIDFNHDGDFDAGEQVANNRAAPNGGGNINLAVAVPSTAISGTTYARFRFSTEQNLLPTGGARDGEVEDYPVILLPGDYGDLPNGYGTTKASNGARHPIWPTNNPTLGSIVDDELDGQPTTNANGDDNANPIGLDDEDGVSFDSELIPGEVMTVTVTAANVANGYLNAWIDFSGDGDFNDTNERLATDRVLTAGTSLVLTTTVPANADQNDEAYARFRFSSRPGLSASGPALDGEVEDYAEPILPLDYGDLPNTYPTEFNDDGARHVIRTGGNPTLGARVDAELDGQDNNAADGDDNANSSILVHGSGSGDDENGVTFNTLWVPGKVATITVSSLITGSGGRSGLLNAWIDFNNDDDFNDPGEQIATNLSLTAGSSRAISFSVPSTASLGNVYSRFRLSSSGDLTPSGLALDGEVEDYRTEIVRLDYGDLPDIYGTTDAANGAYHIVRSDRYLGSRVDAELDGQPSVDALGDDTSLGTGVPNNGDDEDGIIFNTPIAPGTVATLTIVAGGSGNGRFNGWLDFNRNNAFDAGERIFTNTTLAGGGAYSRSFTVPANAQLGQTYARFRYSDNTLASPVGSGGDGEVEDYAVRIVELDYGDAPDGSVAGLPNYATRRANNGARHIISEAPNPTLGSTVDGEPDGQPSLNAAGDDANPPGLDDEDGVTFSGPLVPGESLVITVTASVTNGRLNAWIDFDNDGAFEAGEQIADDVAISAGGSITRSINVPVTATQAVTTYSRFRFSSTPDLGPTGLANDGEVEDYPLPVLPLDYGDLPDSGSPSYPTTRLTNGPRHIINTGANPTLGSRVDAEADGQPNVQATGDDNTNSAILTHGASPGDDEDGVTFDTPWVAGKVATVTVSALAAADGGADGLLNAWIDFNGDGLLAPNEQVATNLNLNAGASGSISFTLPLTVSVSNLYSRFRFSTQSDLTPTGLALDGEVEDYRQLVVELDYGDLPDGYGTTDAAGGAYHVIDPALYLGSTVDDELDGQPNTSATGDDATGSDDEDGVIFEPLIAGRTSALTITAVSGGVLNGWIDWNANDQFDPGEQIFSDRALVNGSNSLSITVPLTASLSDDIYMRFRYSSQSGLPPTGPAPDGEVEDYVTQITAYDFGDALNSYSTQLAQDGAHHAISPTLYLGSRIDIEDDGRPSANALGDDTQLGPGTPADGDDEDGVEFSSLVIGRTATLTVTASSAGRLAAWLDFGDDGDWSAVIDQIFSDKPLITGQNILTFTVPETATVTGATFARFRLSSAGGLSYTGPAPDGEVEDYLVPLIGYDFGDLLDSFQTTALAGGPYHVISPTLYLGSRIDPEGDGQPSPDADGDDANPPSLDDEDGVSFDTPLIPGEVATITVQAVGSGNFSAWLDFNGNGRFDAGERIFTNTLLSPGSTALSFTVPATATPGSTGVRVRYSTANLTSPAGPAPDGEVEDYLIALNRLDFGDLPDDALSPAGYAAQTYPTGLSNNGARHVILAGNNPTLGSTVDAEGDGQPALEALGDDASGDPDDEDGVTFSGALVPGETSLITVTASVTAGLLSAWIDFNGDGDLNDAGEQIAADQSLAAGSSLSLTVNVPLTATRGITSYSRFRFSSQSGLAPTGLALDGEVEDYAIRIAVLDFGDLPNDLSNHPTLAANNGARHIMNPAANPILGLAIDAEADGQPGPDADGDDSAGSPDDEDGVIVPPLIPGETITVTITYSNPTGLTAYLNGWLDTDGDGTLTQILTDEPVAPGASGVLQVPVFISGEPYGSTGYSRFRISTQPGLAVSGLAPDGEVEDYVQTIVGFDFGDLPDDASPPAGYAAQTYPTQLSDSGARHAIMPTNNPTLGATVDAEPDGQPALEADGDDANPIGLDDEDGVGFSGLLVPGEPFVITATVSVTGAYLNAWIDFNGDGDLDDAGEQIAVDRVMVVGDNVFTITVPLEAQQAITTYGRFRLSSDTGLTPTGLAYDGEVEDYGLPTQLLASLGDIVWLDEDGDGERDGSEPGLEDVTVVLWRDTTGNGTPDTPVMTRTTTITGYYRFDYLVPGVVYQVEFRPPAGYSFTVPDNTGDDLDSDANLITGRTPPVILTPGEHNDTLDAGLYRAGLAIDKGVSVAVAAPTQVVTYTLTVTNTGDVPLSSVRITDTLDAGLSYVSGSGSLTPTTVNGQQLVWVASGPGGQLAPNQSLVLTFRVQVPTSASTTLYQNRVAAIGTHPTGTTHPPVTDQVSVVVNDPSVALDKSLVAPGAVNGVVTFTIRITNTGPSVLDELPLFDTFNGPVEYIGGAPPADVIDNANRTLTWLDLTASFGRNLAPGETFEIVTVFRVLQDSARFSMQNTATVPGGVGGANDVLDNPTTEVSDSVRLDNVPTAIELKSFAAERQDNDILVTWETAVEINNYAFRLLRSTSANLSEAVEIALVPGQGAGVSSGASYSYLDQGVEAGRSYRYWLVDIDLAGGETVHGPVLVSPTRPTGGGGSPYYLPIIIK